MVYASTLRHECMGVHTSERAITFFASPCVAWCVAVSQAPIMHILRSTHMCICHFSFSRQHGTERGQSAAGENASRNS